jgi:L-asparaginase
LVASYGQPVDTVTVFSLGGTIAMSRTAPGGVTPAMTAADLVAAVPGLDALGVDVTVRDFRQLPGASLSFEDIVELSAAIRAVPTDGVVVTQGTDTIEETSYLLELLYDGDAPVVVTGAMRNPTMAGADGPANLLAAIQTAASPLAHGLGCLVVFADEIHHARYVRKTHSTSITAFASPGAGPIGHVVEGQPLLRWAPPRQRALASPPPGRPPRIGVYPMTLGDDGTLLSAVAGLVDGLVVAGFGAGHVPAAAVAAVTRLAGRVPVVLTSRTGGGPVLSATYGFAGSESDLLPGG